MAQRTGTPIDASIIARVVSGVRYAITGKTPDAWFGPGEPINPVAQEVAGRQFDFPVTTNLQIRPRANEEISFHDLRGLADHCDILRLGIETRKDQMAKLKWTIQPKDKDVKPDQRCTELINFFLYPDRANDWHTWLRMLIEDLLVIDAPSVYVRLTKGNKPFAFEPIDGATIKRLITSDGRTPLAPDPAYQQILHGIPAVDYSGDELIYLPRNIRTHKLYGYSPVEQIIMTVNTAIRKALFQQQYYTEGTIPDAIIGVPATWSPVQIAQFQEYWDNLLTDNTAERRKVRFVADGVSFHPTKTEPLKDDFDEWLARIICYCLSLPPTPFIKQMNRATADTAQEVATDEGLAPLMQWVKSLIDRIVVKYFGYSDLEFVWVNEKEANPLIQAQIDQIYITIGVKSINEVRTGLGLEAIDQPEDNQNVDTAQPPPEPAPGASEKIAKKKDLKPIDRQRKTVKKATAAMTGIITDLLSEQKKSIIDSILKSYKKIGKADDTSDTDDITDDLDLSAWAAIVGVTKKQLLQIALDGGEEALEQVGVTDETVAAAVADKAEDAADDRAAEMVGKKWVDGELVDNPDAKWSITDGTRSLLKADVQSAFDKGWTNKQLADALSDNYAFSDARALTIARTEIAGMDSRASMIAYRESGVVEGKEWIPDDEACPICLDNADAGVIPLDDDFPSGDDAAPAHPNCECTTSPIVSKLEE